MNTLTSTGICLGLLAALVACGDDVTATSGTDPGPAPPGAIRQVAADGPDVGHNPTAGLTGPLPDSRVTWCVEQYAPPALAGRAFAFDGVVVAIGPSVSDRGGEGDLGLPGVTFEVLEWFSGGDTPTITVDMQPPVTSSADPGDPGHAYDIGSRLLVSGEARWGGPALEDPIAWGCGFSRYYDPDTAKDWSQALADTDR